MAAYRPLIKARYLFFWLLLSFVITILVLGLAGLHLAEDGSEQAWNVALVWVSYGTLFILTALHRRAIGVDFAAIYGEPPEPKQALRLALVGLPTVGIALFCLYVVFAPLSLVWPEWVHWWLFEDPVRFYSADVPYPWLANGFGLAAVVLVAPLVEEWFFRGLLLARWTQKWGVISGVIGSSLVFAVAHVDLLGAFIFGVIMCGLYARYRSLWVPVLVHAANNGIAAVWEVLIAHGGVPTEASVDDLRAAWWLPVVGAALVIPWALRIRKSLIPIDRWEFGARSQHVPTP